MHPRPIKASLCRTHIRAPQPGQRTNSHTPTRQTQNGAVPHAKIRSFLGCNSLAQRPTKFFTLCRPPRRKTYLPARWGLLPQMPMVPSWCWLVSVRRAELPIDRFSEKKERRRPRATAPVARCYGATRPTTARSTPPRIAFDREITPDTDTPHDAADEEKKNARERLSPPHPSAPRSFVFSQMHRSFPF